MKRKVIDEASLSSKVAQICRLEVVPSEELLKQL